MGGTYAGNALSCAAANATIDVIERDNILENVNIRAPQLREGLLALQTKFPGVIRDVRGMGLMIGVEFEAKMTPQFAADVSSHCLKQGMILLTTSTFPCVRFIPPLNVTEQEVALGLEIFEKAIERSL